LGSNSSSLGNLRIPKLFILAIEEDGYTQVKGLLGWWYEVPGRGEWGNSVKGEETHFGEIHFCPSGRSITLEESINFRKGSTGFEKSSQVIDKGGCVSNSLYNWDMGYEDVVGDDVEEGGNGTSLFDSCN